MAFLNEYLVKMKENKNNTSPFSPIKEWANDERPREKMVLKGASALTDAELLAILINTGTANKSALDIAKEILQKCDNNLLELSKMNVTQMKRIKGLGEKKATTLLAALELGKRRQLSKNLENPIVKSSRDAFNFLSPYFHGLNVEVVYVIYMFHSGKIISVQQISNGGINSTVVDVRVILAKALELKLATRIILAHNHPSGNLKPSQADIQITQKLKQAALLLEMTLDDHIILCGNEYISLADEGML